MSCTGAHGTYGAPWYTWRAQVILDSNPNRVVQEWGPHGLFSAGYRVSVPVMGALLQRVAGIDRYTFSTLFMIGIPLLAGLALGAAFYRSRRNPLVIHMAILAAVALFLSTPYIGYLDNATVLFLLCLTIPFLETARTSWGAVLGRRSIERCLLRRNHHPMFFTSSA